MLEVETFIVASKEVLIEAVAHIILVYSLACFVFPRGLCDGVTSIVQ